MPITDPAGPGGITLVVFGGVTMENQLVLGDLRQSRSAEGVRRLRDSQYAGGIPSDRSRDSNEGLPS